MGNAGSGMLYYLVSDICEELEHFVHTGRRPGKDRYTDIEYHVFPQEQEELMIKRWERFGLTVSYCRQHVELADRIAIKYMKVQNTKTGLGISVIPWFMAAGRPYPIFVYVYAIGHYQNAEKKSLEESAAAVRKLFGIGSFHKSTVSRSIRAMEGFVGASRLCQPLAADALKAPPGPPDDRGGARMAYEGIVEQAAAILAACPSFEALERELGEKARRLPEPINRAGRIAVALGGIPDGLFKIITNNGPGRVPPRSRRGRPPRPSGKGAGRVQRPLEFAGYQQREEERRAIIAISRALALDAAARCHRFLV